MCVTHIAKVPMYWLGRHMKAAKKYATSKQSPTRERLELLKEREFARDACVGAAMNESR